MSACVQSYRNGVKCVHTVELYVGKVSENLCARAKLFALGLTKALPE